jgi:phosphoglycerate dehydrogenase-like enzyme
VARAGLRVPGKKAAVTQPLVVVLGEVNDRPPGIEAALDDVELRYAAGAEELAELAPSTQAVYFWRADRDQLPSAWTRFERLRWIQSASAGVDFLLFPALVQSDVVVTNARGVFDEPIAEWVLAMVLAFATDTLRTLSLQRERRWEHRETRRLAGSRLVIVGPGPIGRAAARKARALGMQVTAVGRTARLDGELGRVAPIDRLHETLASADHVLNALPLAPGTAGLFDAAAFAAMRPSATFVNVGRGATVNEPALISALRDGVIAAAALDVFTEEPLPADSRLWSLPNVVVSPHMCGDFRGWEEAVVAIFVENAGRWVRGEPLRNVVDKRLGFGVA